MGASANLFVFISLLVIRDATSAAASLPIAALKEELLKETPAEAEFVQESGIADDLLKDPPQWAKDMVQATYDTTTACRAAKAEIDTDTSKRVMFRRAVIWARDNGVCVDRYVGCTCAFLKEADVCMYDEPPFQTAGPHCQKTCGTCSAKK